MWMCRVALRLRCGVFFWKRAGDFWCGGWVSYFQAKRQLKTSASSCLFELLAQTSSAEISEPRVLIGFHMQRDVAPTAKFSFK